jgi:2-polyprenyl-3-methyl-5-hydroxy-6-metoxy-1,4-benzoquinol methylase
MTSAKGNKRDIQEWWAENPMTYGQVHGRVKYNDGVYDVGSREFFDRVDQEFYSWNRPLHDKKPFDRLFPYEDFINSNVLEIGCGMGTMLMNWAFNGAKCTGVDLNPTSIEQTRKRFEIHGLIGNIRLEDANNLSFKDNQFDYVYSWGVLHHSPNLDQSIKELFRVLKPGGGFGVMLYNRRSFYQWYMTAYVEGFLHNENQWLTPLELNSRYGDGAREEGNPYTWPVTKNEGLAMISPFSRDSCVRILGTELDDVLRKMIPGLGNHLPKFMIKSLARRWGWSLWFYGHKAS